MTATADTELTPGQLRQAAYDWGLTPYEYERILEGLGRQPTLTEIAMFSVEWCEHCGYPKSRNVLRTLPNRSSKAEVLVGADSGGFYLTPDLAVVMKVESHNHPSQVEPYQGAATGVGGSSATSLPAGRARLPRATRSASGRSRTPTPVTCSRAWCTASAATATRSACRPSP